MLFSILFLLLLPLFVCLPHYISMILFSFDFQITHNALLLQVTPFKNSITPTITIIPSPLAYLRKQTNRTTQTPIPADWMQWPRAQSNRTTCQSTATARIGQNCNTRQKILTVPKRNPYNSYEAKQARTLRDESHARQKTLLNTKLNLASLSTS